MSIMDATRELDLPIPSFRQLAVVVALVAAIAVGVFAGLSLTGSDSGAASGSGTTASLDQPAAGNCIQQVAVEGGVLAGNERPGRCDDAGGRPVEGLQP